MKTIDELLAIERPPKVIKGSFHNTKLLLRMSPSERTPAICNIIIENNLGLVTKEANRYWGIYKKHIQTVLDYDDLVNTGMLGLYTAVQRFNFSFNTEFSTYAVHWIRQSIQREIDNNLYQVRIPIHMQERMRQAKKAYSYASDDEKKRYQEIKFSFQHNVSLDQTLSSENGESHIIDFIGSNSSYKEFDPEYCAIQSDISRIIFDGISKLKNPRDGEILILRFGLNDNVERTLEEVGLLYNITRERVRQICDRAIDRIFKSHKEYILEREEIEE